MNYNFRSLKNIVDDINIDFNIDMDSVKNSEIFNNINKILSSIDTLSVEKVHQINLNKIHDKEQNPIMYLLMKRLKELDLIDQLFAYSTNIDNFITFTSWFREHNHLLNFNKLQKILNSSNDEQIIRYRDILFNPPNDRKVIHEVLYKNNFVSLDVQHHYESEDIIYEKYEGDNLVINLYKLKEDTQEYIDRIVKTVSLMRMIAKEYNGSTNSLTLNIFLGNQTKRISINSDDPIPLCSDNINSGSCLPGMFVNIWRKEELLKVLIHELIHFHGFDFNYMDKDYNVLQNVIDNRINVDGIDRCNESFTESFAILIYLCVHSKLLGVSFDTLFIMELKFLLFQVCKTIKYFNGKSIRDMFRISFIQNTSVRSYFIIKFIILLNLDKFVKFIDNNGCVMGNKISTYSTFIDELLSDRKYLIDTHNIFNSINNMNNMSFPIITMRMSLLDFP